MCARAVPGTVTAVHELVLELVFGSLTLALSMVCLCECYGQKLGRAPVGFGHRMGTNRARAIFGVIVIGFATNGDGQRRISFGHGLGTKNPPHRRVAFVQHTVCTMILGGYGWARTTDPGIMSAVL